MGPRPKESIREAPAAVVKRDCARVVFGRSKIDSAITRTARAAGEFSARDAVRIGQRVARALAARAGAAVPIEEIQDAVELALLRAGHLKTARAYIVYREQHSKLRTDRKTMVVQQVVK